VSDLLSLQCSIHQPGTIKSTLQGETQTQPISFVRFNIINENEISLVIKDNDVISDSKVGHGVVNLVRARQYGSDTQQVQIIHDSKPHGKDCSPAHLVTLPYVVGTHLFLPLPQGLSKCS
jgi:hypothetical protein